jgi:hypothetical protein
MDLCVCVCVQIKVGYGPVCVCVCVYKPRLGFEFLYVGSHEYELSMLATHFNMVSITYDWNNRTTVEGIS